MARCAVPGELSGRRGVATLVHSFRLRWRSRSSLQAFAEVWRYATTQTGVSTVFMGGAVL
jgi:hypothetical protein